MIKTILTAFATYLATTIDDIFVVTMLYAGAKNRKEKRNITAGEFAGLSATFLIGLAGAFAARLIPEKFIGLLGIIPIIVAVKFIIEAVKEKDDDDGIEVKSLSVISVALISLSNGGDNIGVYIPVLAEYGIPEIIISFAVLLVYISLFCLLAYGIGRVPVIRKIVSRYKNILIPAVLIILGAYILISHYLPLGG